jgi:hypothetical protein
MGSSQQQVTALLILTTAQIFTQNVRSSSHLVCVWSALCDTTARRVINWECLKAQFIGQFLAGGMCRRKSTSESLINDIGGGLADEPNAARTQ